MDVLVERFGWGYPFPACIDQREVRGLGGVCARYPLSCVLALVVDSLVGLDSRPRVLDLTYGVGLFYAAWRRFIGFLAGIDVERWPWVVEPDLFLRGRFQEKVRELGGEWFDVVFFDPPYNTTPSSRVLGSRPWLYHRVEPVSGMIRDLPAALRHIEFRILVVKIQDPYVGGYLDYDSSHYAVVEALQEYPLRLHIVFRNLHRRRPRRRGQKWIMNYTHILVFAGHA